jgi:hypothetical protein
VISSGDAGSTSFAFSAPVECEFRCLRCIEACTLAAPVVPRGACRRDVVRRTCMSMLLCQLFFFSVFNLLDFCMCS